MTNIVLSCAANDNQNASLKERKKTVRTRRRLSEPSHPKVLSVRTFSIIWRPARECVIL